jgi:PAS domain S-box-containing protein
MIALVSAPHLGVAGAVFALIAAVAGAAIVTGSVIHAMSPAFERRLSQVMQRANNAEAQYRSIFDNAVEGIFQTTEDGRYLKANPMLAQIYGYESPEQMMVSLTNIGSQLYVDEDRRIEFRRILQQEGAIYNFDSQVRRRDGEVIWIRENARSIRNPSGAVVGYEGTVVDITARRQAQDELAKSRERERATAGRIQQTLLLGDPPRDLPWLEIGVFTQASQAIDGDFYDFYRYNDHCIDVLIGDVMGKGIPAALLGAGIKSRYLRAIGQLLFAGGESKLPEPEQVISMMHSELTSHFIGLEFFATMCYLRFDSRKKRVTYVDCGHAKTIRCSSAGEIEMLESECVPIGFSELETYSQCCAPYSHGDIFVCYSDGVTEAANKEGDMFGLDRLTALVAENYASDPESLTEIIKSEVLAYADGVPLGDDLTILIIRTV